MQGISSFLSRQITILYICLFTAPLCAGTIAMTDSGTELRLHTGLLNGESGEYVYDAYGASSGIKGYKLSELNWQLGNVPMAGLGLSFPVNNTFRINLDYWKNIGEGDGTMDDYDWLYVGYDWSHWSHHENTTIRDVSKVDISADINLHRFYEDQVQVVGILGYRQDHFDWQARSGYGIYSNSSYRDTYVIFPSGAGISYEQTFSTPYLGLGITSINHANGIDMRLSARVRYSRWAHGEDIDTHHLRDLRFEDEGDGGEWIGVDLGMDYAINKQLSFLIGYNYQAYSEIKATTLITNLNTGSKTYYSGDAAGLDHSSHTISLGLNYYF